MMKAEMNKKELNNYLASEDFKNYSLELLKKVKVDKNFSSQLLSEVSEIFKKDKEGVVPLSFNSNQTKEIIEFNCKSKLQGRLRFLQLKIKNSK